MKGCAHDGRERLGRISLLTSNSPVAAATSSPCCAPVTDTWPNENVSKAIHPLHMVEANEARPERRSKQSTSAGAPASGSRKGRGTPKILFSVGCAHDPARRALIRQRVARRTFSTLRLMLDFHRKKLNIQVMLVSQTFAGELPAWLGQLRNLKFLHLSDSKLAGEQTRVLKYCEDEPQPGANTTYLFESRKTVLSFPYSFRLCSFAAGPIPPELESLGALQVLFLGDNKLNG